MKSIRDLSNKELAESLARCKAIEEAMKAHLVVLGTEIAKRMIKEENAV